MRVVLFTGKGGVGKTTTAAATALAFAERGTKTLLLSTDSAHSLADALAVPLGAEPVEVAPALWAVQLDTQDRFEAAWRDVQSYLARLLSRGGVDPVTADELTVLPGIEEVLALLAVDEFARLGDWDALVLDCAPTAETLRLLALPEALSWYLSKVFPAQRRLARGMRPIASLFGRADVMAPDAVFAALLRLNDDLAAVHDLLADPVVTSVRLVLTPEAVVVAEARRTFTALALYGYPVDLVVANRVFPGGDADGWLAGWSRAHQDQLLAVRESFVGVPVREVPYLDSEPVGVDELRALAGVLYGDEDPGAVRASGELLRVDADGDDFVLRIALPFATREDVDAARAGDDLVITLGGHRRILALPSVLRRCQVGGGGFADGVLSLRFRRDPQLWPRPDPGPDSRPDAGPGARADSADRTR